MSGQTYYRQGREVCKRGPVPNSIALCESTTAAEEIVTALNSNSDLLAALKLARDLLGVTDEFAPIGVPHSEIKQIEDAIKAAEKQSAGEQP